MIGYRLIEGFIYYFNPKAEKALIEKLSQKENDIYQILFYLLDTCLIALIYSFFFLSAFKFFVYGLTTIFSGIVKQEYRAYLKIKYGFFQTTLKRYYKRFFKKDLNQKMEKLIVYSYTFIIHLIVGYGLIKLMVALKLF